MSTDKQPDIDPVEATTEADVSDGSEQKQGPAEPPRI
jgi:hypothetical protein